jgi:hypothetical protein
MKRCSRALAGRAAGLVSAVAADAHNGSRRPASVAEVASKNNRREWLVAVAFRGKQRRFSGRCPALLGAVLIVSIVRLTSIERTPTDPIGVVPTNGDRIARSFATHPCLLFAILAKKKEVSFSGKGASLHPIARVFESLRSGRTTELPVAAVTSVKPFPNGPCFDGRGRIMQYFA